MKKFTNIFFVALLSITLLTSCGLLHHNQGTTGAATAATDKQKDKIELIDKKLVAADLAKLDQIGEFSYGVGYAIDRISDTNITPEIKIAYDLNTRVIYLAHQPSLEAVKEMQIIVNNLITNNVAGKKLLASKDKQVIGLQQDIIDLNIAKEKELEKQGKLMDKIAGERDQYKKTLSDMDSWFGLGAVAYGLKKFFITNLIIFAVLAGLYIVLRIFASANPVVGAIFSIFEQVVSWFIRAVQYAFPKAVNMAGFVAQKTYDTTKTALVKVVDAVEMAKAKGVDVSTITDETAKSMDTTHKEVVAGVKKDLNWK